MLNILNHLLVIIKWQEQIIQYLCVLVFGKSFKPKVEKCTDKKYMKLSVDPLPVFGEPPIKQKRQYAELLTEYRNKYGKELKPVRRRGYNIPPDKAGLSLLWRPS